MPVRSFARKMALLGGQSFDAYIANTYPFADMDWHKGQDTSGAVALSDNTALALGRNLAGLTYADYTAGANWTNSSAQLALHSAGSVETFAQAGILAVSKTYTIVTIISTCTAGSVIITGTGAVAMTADGSHTDNITATGTALTYTPSTDFDGTINCATVTCKQTGILSDTSYPGAEELNEAGASGTATAANWGVVLNATLTNPSTGLLRIARDGTNNPGCRQFPTVVGSRNLIYAEARSDASASPRITDNIGLFNTGTTSTDWQVFNFEIVAVGTNVQLQSVTSTGTEYTEWRNISVKVANPMHGDYSGTLLGTPASGTKLGYKPYYVTNDYLDVLSAEKNSKTDPTSYHEVLFIEPTWDTTERYILNYYVDADNWIRIIDTATKGTITWEHRAGGTTGSVSLATGSPSGLFAVGISVESAVMKAWYKTGQTGANQSVAGTFVGNFAQMDIGSDGGSSKFFNGYITRIGSATSELSVAHWLDLVQKSGI